MAAVDDLDEVIEQYHLALGEFLNGNPEPVKKIFSHGEDVTLANPFGPPARGWEQVAQTIERAASQFRDRAGEGQGWRKRGYRSKRCAGYDDLSPRRR